MTRITSQISISLDGYIAGPGQSREEPLGSGGEQLHRWAFGGGDEVDRQVAREMQDHTGAYVMGRNMFGPPHGAPDEQWRGWWGEDPPYHAPVFVLTHRARQPLEMDGGTTFHFVTTGIEDALDRARAAAGDLDVQIAGGAQTVGQYLRAGLIDELHLHHVPVLLGSGARLFDGVGPGSAEIVACAATASATHVRYRLRR